MILILLMLVTALDDQNWAKQVEFINAQDKHPFLIAGYGFGKTNTIPKRFSRLWTQDIEMGVESPYLFNVGLKASHNEDVIRPEFESFFNKYDLDWKYYPDKTKSYYKIYQKHYLTQKVHEITIKLLSAERPDKVVGFNATHGNIDEFDVLKFSNARELWVKCLGRVRKVKGGSLSATTTPEGYKFCYWACVRSKYEDYDGRRWLDDKGNEVEREPIARYIQAKTLDNTTLGDDFVDTLKRNLDPKRFKAYTQGIFVNFSAGQVFDYWNESFIKKQDILRGEHYTFWDFGYRNMMYVGFCVVNGNDIHVYDEIGITKKDTGYVSKMALEIRHPNTVFDYCDPAGNQHHSASGDMNDVRIMRENGLNPKWMQSRIVSRIRLINNLHSKGRLTVDPKCKHLIDSFENSVYPDPVNGVYSETPVKDSMYDHARDAFGYFVVNRFHYEVIN